MNQPLVGAEVVLFLSGPGNLRERLEARTNGSGQVVFNYATFFSVLGIIVSPYGGFWPAVVRGGGATIDITCRPLPQNGPREWWHRIMDARSDGDMARLQDGNGIRVGVIDSGCGPHPALDHVENCGAIIDGLMLNDPTEGLDSGSHDTHVCGIVGARSGVINDYEGIAVAAELMSVRVFPPNGGANQGDIADAIDLLSRDKGADLINMSLGATVGSQIERDAITDALERGTLCVCATANSAGPVEFPAAFPETIAVGANGLLGWVPAESFPALPTDQALFGVSNCMRGTSLASGRKSPAALVALASSPRCLSASVKWPPMRRRMEHQWPVLPHVQLWTRYCPMTRITNAWHAIRCGRVMRGLY